MKTALKEIKSSRMNRRTVLAAALTSLIGTQPAFAEERTCPKPGDQPPSPDENGFCTRGWAYVLADNTCVLCKGKAWICKKKNHPKLVQFPDGTCHCCRRTWHGTDPRFETIKAKIKAKIKAEFHGKGDGKCWRYNPKICKET